MRKVAVLLADGFEEVEAITIIDYLRRAGINVFMTAVSGNATVDGAHKVTVKADIGINDLPEDLDGVVVPGGMPGSSNIADSDTAIRLIQDMYEQGNLVAAICAAPAVVLGKAGILKGKNFTCYPGFESQVSGAKFSEDRVVIDGSLITSRSPGTAIEFSLALIEYLVDADTAQGIASGTLAK